MDCANKQQQTVVLLLFAKWHHDIVCLELSLPAYNSRRPEPLASRTWAQDNRSVRSRNHLYVNVWETPSPMLTTEQSEKQACFPAFIYAVIRISFTEYWILISKAEFVCLLSVPLTHWGSLRGDFSLEIYGPGAQDCLQAAALVPVDSSRDNSELALQSRLLPTL